MAEPVYAVYDKLRKRSVGIVFYSLQECSTRLKEMQDARVEAGDIVLPMTHGYRIKGTSEEYAVVSFYLREPEIKYARKKRPTVVEIITEVAEEVESEEDD